jgi:hypothetical protein
MEKLIYLFSHSLPDELCDEIIELYHSEHATNGITYSGYNPTIKKTKDFTIPNNSQKWEKVRTLLQYELNRHINAYLNNIQSLILPAQPDYQLFQHNFVFENTFMIQKYYKNTGFFIYHNDAQLLHNTNFGLSYRLATYLWYLNDVSEGGETDLWYGTNKIIPKKGSLFLFPALHSFPHAGNMPITDDKYIITGWIYQKV